MNDKKCAYELKITGLVQGVGFRPFIYRLAHELGVTGNVRNQTDGVRIHVEGASTAVEAFVAGIRSRAPVAAAVDEIEATEVAATGTERFVIVKSADFSDLVTRISPDLPVCADCLADLERDPRRLDYPHRGRYALGV